MDSDDASPLRIVCLADTHGRHSSMKVPPGDILLHAGDWSLQGRYASSFAEWFSALPHPHKVVVEGNHELGVCDRATLFPPAAVHYLCDSSVVLCCRNGRRVKVHGCSYNLPSANGRSPYAEAIPSDADVLLVHGPPKDILDGGLGCNALKQAVDRVSRYLVAFGHVQ